MNKKDAAIVLGFSGNISFSAGTLLLGIKKHLKRNVDIIIYSSGLSETDKTILGKIIPCEFIHYEFPFLNFEVCRLSEKYTLLTFSRYECFKLLDRFKRVLWLDTDILVEHDFSVLFSDSEYACPSGISMFYQKNSVLKQNFTQYIEGYDLERGFYNAGVILLTDQFSQPHEAHRWCYEKTLQWADALALPDQAILNLLLQEFSLDVRNMPEKYNAHPRVYRHIKEPAILVHPYGSKKFWNRYFFSDWNNYYAHWLALGGSAYTGVKSPYIRRILKMLSLSIPPLTGPKEYIKSWFSKVFG